MEKHYEQRGGYNIAYYSVSIDDSMKKSAMDFATKIILSDNQYSRLLPDFLKESADVSLQQKIEIQRTFTGKLGELAFFEVFARV